MAEAYKCDRCGEYLDVYSIVCKDNELNDVKGIPTLTKRIDVPNGWLNKGDKIQLCEKCAESFNRWLDEEV